MNMKELQAAIAASQQRLAQHRAGKAPAGEPIKHYGYFELDMFECPPFLMFSNNDAPVVHYLMHSGTFEPFSMAIWCRLAVRATGILDIGANVGIYSLAAAKLRPDLSIHAYEPNPYAFARLRVHKFLNDLSNLIEHPVAVHRKSGVASISWFVRAGGHISSGTMIGTAPGKDSAITIIEPIDGTGLAGTLGLRPLVKIDVEGAELNVMEAMQEVLALRPDIIIETFHQPSCDAINAMLKPLGYSVYAIHELKRKLIPKAELTACDPKDPEHDYNQFLSVRPAAEIRALTEGK